MGPLVIREISDRKCGRVVGVVENLSTKTLRRSRTFQSALKEAGSGSPGFAACTTIQSLLSRGVPQEFCSEASNSQVK